MFRIEIDCEPFGPRPCDLLPGVLVGTGVVIDPQDTVSRLFGNWEWVIPAEHEAKYKEVRETVRARITALYAGGIIRYGSW